jgi:hypothetical protein
LGHHSIKVGASRRWGAWGPFRCGRHAANLGARLAESNRTALHGRPWRARLRSVCCRLGDIVVERRHSAALIKHRSGCHPHLREFEESLALLCGARRARPLDAFVGDLTIFLGSGHTGSSPLIQAGARLVSQSPTPGPSAAVGDAGQLAGRRRCSATETEEGPTDSSAPSSPARSILPLSRDREREFEVDGRHQLLPGAAHLLSNLGDDCLMHRSK